MDINELFEFVPKKVDNGYDIIVKPKGGMKIVVCRNGYDEMTVKLRDVIFPKVGSSRTIAGRLEKVKDIDIDGDGNIFVVNEFDIKIPWA